MCNIAGYVGEHDAAPILIDMMRRQQSFAGGYYTGIATLCDGVIHYAKITGDLDTLLQKTNALQLPGHIGIIHSRSKSGGGDAWSHPFIGRNGNCAYVANGWAGIFKERVPAYTTIADHLLDEGYTMALEPPMNASYPTVSNGMSVHMSDVMAQLISSKLDEGEDPQNAIETAFCEMPSEIVGLLLSVAEPNAIAYARINMPMTVAYADHGAYLASTPLAHPEDAGAYEWLPVLSSGKIYADHRESRLFEAPPCTVAAVTEEIRQAVYELFLRQVKDSRMSAIEKMVRPLFAPADCYQEPALLYDVLFRLRTENKLKIETRRLPGAREDLTAPAYFMTVVNDMKKLLLIGDSIRMGYDKAVKKTLEGKAEVFFPGENCRFSANVLRFFHEWLKLAGNDGVDVIHWNAGLWDNLRLFGEDPHTPLEMYVYYIERICIRIKKLCPNAKVIFATSTRVLSEKMSADFKRYNEDIEAYNAAAVEVVKKYGFEVNDLYAVSAALPEEAHSDAVHYYTPMGTEALANKVLACTAPALGLAEVPEYKEALYTDAPIGI